MGWFWTSTKPAEPPVVPHQLEQAAPLLTTPIPTPIKPSTSPSDSSIDPELQKFVDLFSASTQPTQPISSSSPSSSPTSSLPSWLPQSLRPSSSSTPTSPNSHIPPRLSPPSEALLPPTLSCHTLFDVAFSCQSFGGQWSSVYRTGSMRTCSDLWSDFWFCMRHNGSEGPVTEELIRAHYRKKEWEKYYAPGKKSSEDIWRGREELVPVGTAFKTPVAEFED